MVVNPKILVGYTGSSASDTALDLAGRLSRQLNGHLIIILSMDGGKRETIHDIHKSQALLKEAHKRMSDEGISCEILETARGLSPGEDVVLFARDNKVDMIVVGVEKKSKTQKLIMGSTAQHIILKAHCPVLTVK